MYENSNETPIFNKVESLNSQNGSSVHRTPSICKRTGSVINQNFMHLSKHLANYDDTA